MNRLVRHTTMLALVLFSWSASAQETVVRSPFTVATFRHRFDSALVSWSILTNLKSPLQNADDEYDFQSAFWPMELIGYKSPYVHQRLSFAFQRAAACSPDFQRRLVEIVYTNYPDSFSTQVRQIMAQTDSPKVFAISAEYLWRGGRHPAEQEGIESLLQMKFQGADLATHPVLRILQRRLARASPSPGFRPSPETIPSLVSLFSEEFAPGLTVVYSFQRKDRDYPGLAVVRRPDGHFVRNPDGTIFAVPQLARSITDLPFYLTNGNTPQGVYRMSGFAHSSSRFIGPTTDIQLSLPYEIPPDSFLVTPAPGDTTWTMDAYQNLLPIAWRGYAPAFDAYYAGKAGRTAIIAHGTTINPEYYKGTPYYPWTPSQGCLCAHETWDPITGIRLKSDQQKLVDAVASAGNGTGYGCVMDLSDAHAPVRIQEILPFILEAEKNL